MEQICGGGLHALPKNLHNQETFLGVGIIWIARILAESGLIPIWRELALCFVKSHAWFVTQCTIVLILCLAINKNIIYKTYA